MRIASLVPSATELLFAMGLGDDVVAVTHECDYPLEATDLPQLTTSVIPAELPPNEVDALVRGLVGEGKSLYTLDEELLKEEEPDLIIAQQLCDVCVVSYEDVKAIAARLESQPKVISLDPTTFGEVLGDIRTIARATDEKDLGVDLVQQLADRVDDVKIALKDVGRDAGPDPITVAALEWLDPIFLGGHWVPQMIEVAGGIDFLGLPGEPSRESSWEEVAAAEPNTIVLMQCGYDAARSADEAEDFAEQLGGLGAERIFATDANAYFSRPGPRLVDGIELLAHALHPTLVPEPASGAMIPLELG
jgi:iron complex transport system substrate-binding protein